ncbi:hypothetical protein ACFQ8C_24955 [Streptomyces sp. NPDC056503]|uniref:hypothetical protein n=1 Tax=Streptomyces sp. NPDC056503 TaxID=3345842 RepID=UPI003676098A
MTRSSIPPGSVRTRVTITGTENYEAVVDPSDRWNGFVSPYFTLDTVRQLSADTLAMAEAGGYDYADTVHVIDGGSEADGTPRAIVLHISWTFLADEGPAQVASIISPREEDGLYCIGGWEWTWSISTWGCACGNCWDHHKDTCPDCGDKRTTNEPTP